MEILIFPYRLDFPTEYIVGWRDGLSFFGGFPTEYIVWVERWIVFFLGVSFLGVSFLGGSFFWDTSFVEGILRP